MTPVGIVVALLAFVLGAAAATAVWYARRRGDTRARARGSGDTDLAVLRREIETARQELDEIHSSVSHDLRSPIGAALNFLSVLEEDHGDRLDAEGRAIVARIRRSADSALLLLDGLARLARVGRRTMAHSRVDVEALVREVFATLRPAQRAIELVVVGPLPTVVADPDLLRIAFTELLTNALRFTAGREKAAITVGGRREGADVEYWVADDGVGFDARFGDKLFRVFERLHPREDFPGAGAGLAVVRRVAERHGGRVRAQSEPQRGATFLLSLPAAPQPEPGP